MACKSKSIVFKAFAPTGRFVCALVYPGCYPGLGASALSGRIAAILLSDAEVLEDIVQRFLAADLAAGDFSQLLQYHFQILGDDVAAHSHFH